MILAFDTSGPYCAAALLGSDGTVVASASEDMTRGQAERLFPMLDALLHEAGADWSDLTRIGVGIGPGNFTGIRISVSAARGLALGLGIPAIGVSSFEAIHHTNPQAIAAVPAPRDQAYLCAPGDTPRLVPLADATAAHLPPAPAQLAASIARVAQHKSTDQRPAPLYIRQADAAPSRTLPPVLLDGC
ncbi:tRNA (adenosine(37)-N6)-threonylcarbamoyltransferase complex dimerization subunit type 1 TsaB [Cognatishimia sp. F0-27]|uniref:tRNA (adenosine(37)-N6)-threonylcarbamoyltransferase complex dimerization subunit type 1 TsaB n=1 Tax=Cognatishimia sp. F0-27 TaxID=2816855 RepID=UPI001D0CC411|nr:tRNA (adenosine(37)-N6)-threonylcarbamoyltransferase complex dimerization subunit type 1 TsaB [Cognatishimia sp. F0-27]MCC1492847.1 tRNA (adenosine(37)-N6)-threonylcarbamoyltransferase complex dimerization subunit type 1 TsaB [Cognatishimia sp. F0-27]